MKVHPMLAVLFLLTPLALLACGGGGSSDAPEGNGGYDDHDDEPLAG